MVSVLLIANQRGDHVISRYYRGDVPKSSMDSFQAKVLAAKETGSKPPIIFMDNTSFMYTRHKDLFFIAASRGNANTAIVFEFLYQKIRILKSYLNENFDERDLRDNFTLLYELLDETMDFGLPQNSSIDVLKLYINLGSVQAETDETRDAAQLTSQITGAIDWRREGIRHRKNEVYIDVLESVNLAVSSSGSLLRSDVSGQVIMKTFLSGMPECKFGLNDKLLMAREGPGGRGNRVHAAVEIDDCTFHRCVRLGKFDVERTITFIPPDGEFELMRYRVKQGVTVPFRLEPIVAMHGRTKVSIHLKVFSQFPPAHVATNVTIKIPVPPNSASARISSSKGRGRFEPSQKSIVWRIKRFIGNSSCELTADVETVATTKDKPWARAPITAEFQVPMFTASGLRVRFLKVYDKSNYQPSRWVRYITRAGEYERRF